MAMKAVITKVTQNGKVEIDFTKSIKVSNFYPLFNESIIELCLIPKRDALRISNKQRVLQEKEEIHQIYSNDSEKLKNLKFNWTAIVLNPTQLKIDIKFENPLDISRGVSIKLNYY